MTKKTNKYVEQPVRSDNDKQLELVQLRKNLDNSVKEIETITKAQEETVEKKALLVRMIEVRKGMHAIAMKQYIPLKPNYAFQENPEYIALQKELSDIEFKFEEYKHDGTLNQVEANLKSFKEQIESQEKNVVTLKERIAELEKGD